MMNQSSIDSIIDQLESLNKSNQFKSSEFIGCAIINSSDDVDYRILTVYAESLYGLNEYKRAINYFVKALNKIKACDSLSDSESRKLQNSILLKIANCYMNIRSNKLALDLYKKVPIKEHSVESLLNLAKIATYFENKKTAAKYYCDVLKKDKFCLEAALCLIELNASLDEILPPTSSISPNEKELFNFCTSIITDAYNEYNGISKQTSPFYDEISSKNTHIIKMRAMYLLKIGEYDKAEATFRNIFMSDKDWVDGMDGYAFLLARAGKVKELKELTYSLLKSNSNKSETWTAISLIYNIQKGKEVALQHLSRALSLNPRSLFAYVVRGDLLMLLGRYSMAIQSYKCAWAIQKSVFVGERLVNSIIKGDPSNAISVAKDVSKILKELSPSKALAILGLAHSVDKKYFKEGVKIFEKALEKDPDCIEAIVGLAHVLPFDDACKHIKRHIERQSHFLLHYTLGCLLMDNESTIHEAIFQLEKARKMNETHEGTLNALAEIDLRLRPGEEEEEEDISADLME